MLTTRNSQLARRTSCSTDPSMAAPNKAVPDPVCCASLGRVTAILEDGLPDQSLTVFDSYVSLMVGHDGRIDCERSRPVNLHDLFDND